MTTELAPDRLRSFFAEFRAVQQTPAEVRVAAAWTGQLAEFFATFQLRVGKSRSSFADRLTRLMGGLSGLRRSSAREAAITSNRLAAALGSLRAPLARLRLQGEPLNPWALALGSDEKRNARALAGLWSPVLGDIAIRFLDAFLRRLNDPTLPNLARLRGGYVVRVEDLPLGDASDRVDITIEGAGFLIGVEVKVHASQTPGQLARYYKALTRRAAFGGREAHLMLLASETPRTEFPVHHATWRDVAEAAVAAGPLADRRGGFQHQLLTCFALHVRTFEGTRG